MLGDSLPESGRSGVDGGGLEDDGGDSVGERTVDDICVTLGGGSTASEQGLGRDDVGGSSPVIHPTSAMQA